MRRHLRRDELLNPARPIVCVDLNGVLDSYTGWKHPDHWDPPRRGAKRFLGALIDNGFDIVVFTTRNRVGVRRWLREHDLLEYVSAITDRKPPAHVFVDDRAVCFRGDFKTTLRHVLAFSAHWESGRADHADVSARTRARNASRRTANRKPSGESPSD